MDSHFTEPTTAYWQTIEDGALAGADRDGPWRYGYPAALPDGRVLRLPIRRLPGEASRAVASLILNQASLEVAETLGAMLARQLRPLVCDLLVGLPTLGLSLVPAVARGLGQVRFVPLGYSRKFWYDESLSTPVHSITSPVPGKRLYLDPNQQPLLQHKRVIIIDDAVSSGTTLNAAWDLLDAVGADVIGAGVAMRQGARWIESLGVERAAKVVGVFDSPHLVAVEDAWIRFP